MDQQSSLFAIYKVLFHLGNVVRDIVDHVHVKVIRGGVEHLGKGLCGCELHGIRSYHRLSFHPHDLIPGKMVLQAVSAALNQTTASSSTQLPIIQLICITPNCHASY